MFTRCPLQRSPILPGPSISITFKGLGAYDYPSAFAWPPPQDGDVPSSGQVHSGSSPLSSSSGVRDEYVTRHRSPFSVLRSRQSRVDRCAAGMLGTAFDTSTRYALASHGAAGTPCKNPYCCCSGLMYPAAAPSAALSSSPHADAAERIRDDFLWALRIGGVDDLLRSTLGAELHTRLMQELGVSPATAAVLSCSNPVKMARLMSDDLRGEGSTTAPAEAEHVDAAYVVRLLLSADEDNRIRWLQEESASMEPSDYYSRAPSLRALFVMWSVLQHQQRTHSTAVLGSGGAGRTAADASSDGEGWGGSSRFSAEGPRVRSPASARSPSSLVPCPRMGEIRHVLLRMEERRMEVTMSDLAALAAIGAGGSGSTAVPDGEFWDSLAKQLRPLEVTAALQAQAAQPQAGHVVSDDALELKHVLLLSLFLRYVLLVRAERASLDAGASLPLSPSALASRSKMLLPINAFEAASDVIQLRKSLTEPEAETSDGAATADASSSAPMPASALRDALVVLSDVVLKHAYEMAEESHIPSSSPQLPELTTWLLREMVASPVCEFHFKRLVDRSITEALVALEKSGLVNRSTIDLKVVVRQLLPLLESCGSEDLYTSVLRDVLSALEEKARRDGFAFSATDLQYLAELGAKLFASGPSDNTAGGYGLFDETARGQMEELHVMDGSPWALCVSSYRSLKEMIQGIVRDQRRLKEQVQEQLRQLSNASTSLSAVMTGSGGEAEDSSKGATAGAAQTTQTTTTTDGRAQTTTSTKSSAEGAQAGSTATSSEADTATASAPAPPPRIPVSPMLRQRFLVLIEELVKAQVDESSEHSERPIVVSSELFAFVTQHVPVPNIQDEYRRKIFLLVNVAEDPETTRQRIAQRREERKHRQRADGATGAEGASKLRRRGRRKSKSGDATTAAAADNDGEKESAETGAEEADEEEEVDVDPHGGANDIPAELRFLVSSLPLTLSPWASVMILREVLAESAGRNPRYTYVLNAAIDLQLPISTTRSRIATTLNMWRFLNTQSHKLSLKESLVMKQRCAWNLPLSYILSSYWSLLTWMTLASIITLNVVGIDWESQIVANSLFRMFAPWEEVCAAPTDTPEEGGAEAESWTTQAAADLAADYFEQAEIADRRREEHQRSSTNVFLSSASYLILGYDDQRRPMTVIPIGSDRARAAEERAAEEYAAATAVLRELSLHAPFPFFVDIERALPIELVEMRIAERIRRVSFNNTWFLPRMIIRTFPLGRQYTEHKLILHTCTQANLTRRRVTFLLYMHDGVAVTPQFIQKLNESYLSKHANLVLVVHESSLMKGGTTPASLERISQSGATESSAGIAAAAADMVEAVLPDDVRETASSLAGGAFAATSDRLVRVLPFCRQFYAGDGTVVSDAVRDGERRQCNAAAATGSASVAEEGGSRWWQRLRDYVAGEDKKKAAEETASVKVTPLPLFAATFSSQRASLHRNHQKQREAEEEAAAAAAREQQTQRQRQRDGSSLLGRWTQLWRHALTGVSAIAAPVMRATPDGGWEEDASVLEARRDAAGPSPQGKAPESSADTAAAASAGTTAESASTAGKSSSADPREDGAEERAGKDVVSVSFTALRRLMSEVSAPVPIPRKKSTSGAAGPTTAQTAAMSSSSSSGGGGGVQEHAGATAGNTFDAPYAAAPPSSSGGMWGHWWSSFSTPAAPETKASREKSEPAQTGSSPSMTTSPPLHAAQLRQPYNFTFNNSSNTSANTAGGGTSAAPPISPAPAASSASSSGGAAGMSPSRSPAPLPSLSLSSLPTTDTTRYGSYKWESEWQKTDELLAQLQRSTRQHT